MKKERCNSNEVKFYDSKLDSQFQNAVLLIDLFDLYPNIKKAFGAELLQKLQSESFGALDLQRLGMVEKILTEFRTSEGFDKLLTQMKQISQKIVETEIANTLFEKYRGQLHRYISELLVPYFFTLINCNINEFHPKETGINEKSCDCSIEINGTSIFMEITTINVSIDQKALKLKIDDIFEEKAQQQTVKDPSLLVIDITSSAQERYNKIDNRFEVVFPIFGNMIEYIGEQLDNGEQNFHLVGVLIASNTLCERNGGDFELIYDYYFRPNYNNSHYSLLKDLF